MSKYFLLIPTYLFIWQIFFPHPHPKCTAECGIPKKGMWLWREQHLLLEGNETPDQSSE